MDYPHAGLPVYRPDRGRDIVEAPSRVFAGYEEHPFEAHRFERLCLGNGLFDGEGPSRYIPVLGPEAAVFAAVRAVVRQVKRREKDYPPAEDALFQFPGAPQYLAEHASDPDGKEGFCRFPTLVLTRSGR